MINFYRAKESSPYLTPIPLRSLQNLRHTYATLRQGLYRYFKISGRKKALIPDYSPAGIILPLRDAGLEIIFYPTPIDFILDQNLIQDLVAKHQPDTFIYIHHFGLYIESNLKILKKSLDPKILFIEDFAHSLPHQNEIPQGQIALYTVSKTLSIGEGGLIWFRDKNVELDLPFEPINAKGKILIQRLQANARLANRLASLPKIFPVRTYTWIARLYKLAGLNSNFYPFLKLHYRELGANISSLAIKNLEHFDLAAIIEKRQKLAHLYLRGLDFRFRLVSDDSAYLRQSLVAFPILIQNQEHFHSYLVRKKVLGFRLTDDWFNQEMKPGNLIYHHYLLPLSHYFTEGQIEKVIQVVNAYHP